LILPPPPAAAATTLPVLKKKNKVPDVKKKIATTTASVITPSKQKKTNGTVKKNDQADRAVSKKSSEVNIFPDEDINDGHLILDDTILKGGSDHSLDHHSFSEATAQQHYIVVEEPMHISYDFDGVHLEDTSEERSMHGDSAIPSSVAINIDTTNGNQQQLMNSAGGTNPLFDVSDPSMDDSISKNYDSRYDGSLQDLNYNHGNHNSKGSINHRSGGSWNLNNENPKSNSSAKGDNVDNSDSSSEMDELKGYLSSGELRNPNILLQPYVGERPPTPPSPMRSMNDRAPKQPERGTLTTSPIKSITTKVMIPPKDDVPVDIGPNPDDNVEVEEQYQQRYVTNADLIGIIDLKDELPTSESAPSASMYRNKQFDDFYPTEYNVSNEEIDNVSHDHLLDTSVQPSCTYSNNNQDEEQGQNGSANRGRRDTNNEKDQSTTVENDKEKKQKRTIRILIVVLTCALVALLAMIGGVIVLVLDKDDETSLINSSAPQQPTVSPVMNVSPPTMPTTSITTLAPSSSNVDTVTSVAPQQAVVSTNAPIQPRNSSASLSNTVVPVATPQEVSVPSDAPILRNSSATLTMVPIAAPMAVSVPSDAPILRNSSAVFTNTPIAAPIAVTAPSPVAATATESPTMTSVVLPPI
jgi:hypothetical protein